MTERWFLKVDGIEGESSDARHPDQIEVSSWSIGVTRAGASPGPTPAGRGADRAEYLDLQVRAPTSAASPHFLRLAATGEHIGTAVLSGVRQSGQARDFLTIALSEVTVTSVRLGDDPDTVAIDHYWLAYGRIEVTYLPVSPSGKSAAPITVGLDVG